MEKNIQPIIIKKKKGGHGGHHGGAWKVAYADFVTALMAFFLVMWLLAVVAPEKRAAVAEYMNNYSVFAESGSSFMTGTSQMLNEKGGEFKPTPKGKGREGDLHQEEMAKKMKQAVEEKLASLKNQVTIDITEGGVRAQITDTEVGMMFPSGSAELTQNAKEVLRIMSENIKTVPNRIVIEGHTDAAPFKSAEKTNWELSTARASAARRALEEDGIDSSRIARVVGYADQELLVPENPKDPRNRRISIILLKEKLPPQVNAPAPAVNTSAPAVNAPAPAVNTPAHK